MEGEAQDDLGGVGVLVRGQREGEWLRGWEADVVRAVVGRVVQTSMNQPLEFRGSVAQGLDGY